MFRRGFIRLIALQQVEVACRLPSISFEIDFRLPPWRFASEYECVFNESDQSLFAFDLIAGAFDNTIEPLFDASELAAIAAGSAA